MSGEVPITRSLTIPEGEIQFRFSRSSGPGGQHVNKVATNVELLFNIGESNTLTDAQKEKILSTLKNRVSSQGVLRIKVQESSSQSRNREIAIHRFRDLLAAALETRKKRIPSKPTAAAKEKRVNEKKRRGEIKRHRKSPRA